MQAEQKVMFDDVLVERRCLLFLCYVAGPDHRCKLVR